VVVGAGAAGLLTAIFAARGLGRGKVLLLEGAARPGAKILVSGGGRCNVTNRTVTERDFNGAPAHLVRRVLRAFPAEDTAAFFRAIGVPLHEEEHGKLFPDTNRARTVLEALLREAERWGVELRCGTRVQAVEPIEDGLRVRCGPEGQLVHDAERVVLAAGGLSLPKTGSDGLGHRIAAGLGHAIVPTTPALVPLRLAEPWPKELSGLSHEAALEVQAAGERPRRIPGSLLFTHFGISGPAALDASRHVLRARLEGRPVRLAASLVPALEVEAVTERLLAEARTRPRARVAAALADLLPTRLAEAIVSVAGVPPETPLAHLRREDRRRLAERLVKGELTVTDSRGYDFAEATAGGVPLQEVDLRTMASRQHPRLHLVGEMLDVDGRLGGFNFQWAWSSAFVAGRALGSGLV
jgi:predicted Rossmann fold flavoprotein